MKSKLINNVTLKILSVIFAIVLWLVVMNISDYSITVEIDDIPVTQLNGDVLDELDKVYDVARGDTVDIIVKGRRSVVSRLSASDFTATADLSTMSITNTVQIFVHPRDKSIMDEISITCIDNTMSLNLEEKVSVQFPVKIQTTGNPKEGYAACEAYATPNIITVEGPKSAVDKITSVVAPVSVSGSSSSFENVRSIVLYDAYGEPITNDKLKLSQDVVDVNVNIYPVKSVGIEVAIKGTPGDGYEVAEIIYQPQTVLIAGKEDDIKNIDTIEIDDISVSGLTENLQKTIVLSEYLPDGIFPVQSGEEVVVTVSIEKLESKTITPSVKDIILEGKADGYTYEVILSEDFKIVAYGIRDAVKSVNIFSLKPTIDCSDLEEGSYNNITVKLSEIDGVRYEIAGTVNIVVHGQ